MLTHCDGCRIERVEFMAEPSLWVSNKPRVLLEGWSIGLITNMEPVFSEGYCHCIVAIDCFTKWPEV